jgi:hypothetical protein
MMWLLPVISAPSAFREMDSGPTFGLVTLSKKQPPAANPRQDAGSSAELKIIGFD